MASLIYMAIASLDGYVEDEHGEFDAAAIRQLKETSRSDITIGGAELGGQAIAQGLVDEYQLFFGPVLVGAGKRALPARVHAELELTDERRFGSGVVFLRYRTQT